MSSKPRQPSPAKPSPTSSRHQPRDTTTTTTTTPPPQPTEPSPILSHLSPKALNSFAVHQLSARPGRTGAGAQTSRQWKEVEPLPAKYRPAARRITAAMVAAPIAIVTSYYLYERLVQGKERKEWSRDPVDGETPKRILPGRDEGR